MYTNKENKRKAVNKQTINNDLMVDLTLSVYHSTYQDTEDRFNNKRYYIISCYSLNLNN